MRRRTATWVAGAAALAAAGATGGLARARRVWRAAGDPTDGDPLCLPDGEDSTVATPDGGRLVVRSAGEESGQTFLLAHCWTGDRRVWGPVARRLVADGHRVVLYDHRGHGGSVTGSDGYSVEALAADMRAVIEALDLTDIVIGGHSLGGMATQMLAVEHAATVRERVNALVLVATACDGLGYGGLADQLALRTLEARLVERSLGHRALGPFLVRFTVGRSGVLSHMQAVCDTFIATPAAARVGFLAAMHRLDLRAALADVDVPAWVVCGTRDLLMPPSRTRCLVEALPGAELLVIDDAGHMLPFERPAEITEVLERAAKEGAHRR